MDSRNIILSHFSKPGYAVFLVQLVILNHATHAHLFGKVTEANINELLGVQVSVPVLSASDGSRESLSSCVDGLPDVSKVNSTSDFLNQDRGKSKLSETLVCAQEVDFSHLDGLTLDGHINGNTRNESVEVVLRFVSNSNNPVGVVARRIKSPFNELRRIVKAEFTIIVFNVVSDK